ncbi:MAG: Methionyl-tRNA formyltransferase [Patescibacteria group bacterium]|nr:Methionyl-tRNA formyltransferase [Patescibacteria group bacterium]
MINKPNFVFFGTPDVASETLEILKQAGYLPSLIVTSPDKPKGRKMLLTPPPVKTWAIENSIPYIQPEKINDLVLEIQNVDLFIVVAYGKIMPEKLIKLPRLGSINIHYSLLPKYRGASPVESAILNGDIQTGVSIQQMEYKMDTGQILVVEKIEILPDEKSGELRTRLIKIGGELLVKMLPDFIDGKITTIPQDETQAINCKKMTKEDGLIDLDGDSVMNYNKFRAYATWPRTYFFKDNKRVIITDAELSDGKFVIKKIIPEGGKEQEYKD